MSQKRKARGTRFLALSVACIAAACGSDGDGTAAVVETPTAELVVNLEFASELTKTVTYSFHVWALRPRDGKELTCNELIGGKADPYDYAFDRLADHVSTDVGEPVTVEAVELGEAFIYVEGVSFGGETETAGCVTATLEEPSTSVDVTLKTAGVFDCSDSDTEDGAPCDDGEFCTVGETCQDGTCEGGGARDCSALASDCSAAECTEAEGCQVSPVADDTPCDDGLLCTGSDTCQEGICVGTALDCDAQAGPCQVATGCDEFSGACLFANANEGLDCDDGLHCTVDTICSFGECVGATRDCSLEVGDDCNTAACSEDEGGCYTTFAADTTLCDDSATECTEATGYCDGAGTCEVLPANEGDPCESSTGICSATGVCELN